MNVTISGLPGSGTTTLAKILEEKLTLRHVYTGKIFRDTAKKYEMDVVAFGEYCQKHPEIDREIDRNQEKILREGNTILEGRIAGWIAHLKKIAAMKIWLECDRKTRVARIIKREGGNLAAKMAETTRREKSEHWRYKEYYGIDLADKEIYDLNVDTTHKTPEEIAQIVMDAL
jgi:cytidylate kinase